jgi:hypothetical protein
VTHEAFDLLFGGVSEFCRSTVIGGIGFDEIGVEAMLANQEAKAVAQSWLTIDMAAV